MSESGRKQRPAFGAAHLHVVEKSFLFGREVLGVLPVVRSPLPVSRRLRIGRWLSAEARNFGAQLLGGGSCEVRLGSIVGPSHPVAQTARLELVILATGKGFVKD